MLLKCLQLSNSLLKLFFYPCIVYNVYFYTENNRQLELDFQCNKSKTRVKVFPIASIARVGLLEVLQIWILEQRINKLLV